MAIIETITRPEKRNIPYREERAPFPRSFFIAETSRANPPELSGTLRTQPDDIKGYDRVPDSGGREEGTGTSQVKGHLNSQLARESSTRKPPSSHAPPSERSRVFSRS
ncbi:hypothetical protein GWI33_014408 [Rhynchophorus ferrugineus]|uniref:Uncharacterized protein n=1 Tax=Rhynchophorus ferrugineus TaxID=354439 RepID=A0A834I2P1_RHYFE|nr:hypothetical protein GWI33_014408 [Rhynchophorus ferrugineus]